mgnify:CR=1 FL=1
MNQRIIGAFLLGAALCIASGPARAMQNVANTSQQGSLLIFPLINVDPTDTSDTFIEIGNDQSSAVQVECEYVNEEKGRVDFTFTLTHNAVISWEALEGQGDVFSVSPFPYGGNYPQLGSDRYGELVCFAVDNSNSHQIAFNHLTGTATVVNFYDGDAEQTKQAFKYNAWAFAARGTGPGGLANDNVVQGTAGTLWLTGGGAGTYDACPLYNTALFMPNGAYLGPSGYSITTLDNDLAVSSCNQDLRQDFNVHLTKLQFTVYNEIETGFTGAYDCVDSTQDVGLSYADNSYLVAAQNFDYSTVRTANARFRVQGVASTQCSLTVPNPVNPSTNIIIKSENAGLLGVITSSLGIDSSYEDQEIGNTTQGAGTEVGYVLWDPGSGGAPARPRH